MVRNALLPLLVGALLAGAVPAGCQQKLQYSGGVGGNLVRVKGDPADGTAVYVPVDQLEKYKQAKTENSDVSSDLKE
jgi:hypothetical protein